MPAQPHTWKLYGIFDLAYAAETEAGRVCSEMCEGGVDVIQLRAKNRPPETLRHLADTIRRVTAAAGRAFIVNDHPALAAESGADGVHLGQDDGPLAPARALRPGLLAGRSTHSPAQARAALSEGADYIGFGPLFPTPTKPGRPAIGLADIQSVQSSLPIPVFCIGGVKLENLPAVIEAGARRVVVVSGILLADDIRAYCRSLRALLDSVA